MARPSGNTTQIGFDKNILTVTHGQCTASAPADQIDTLIRVLEAARLMVASGGRINLSGPAAAAVAAAAVTISLRAVCSAVRLGPRRSDRRQSRNRGEMSRQNTAVSNVPGAAIEKSRKL